jgi:hypothetical protein
VDPRAGRDAVENRTRTAVPTEMSGLLHCVEDTGYVVFCEQLLTADVIDGSKS